MKLRLQNDGESQRVLNLREFPATMEPDSKEHGTYSGTDLSLNPELLTRTPGTGNPEVRIPITSRPGESGGGPSSRRSRVSHSHSHRAQLHSEPEPNAPESESDSGEPTSSFSELRCLFRWIQKSLPFLVILCAKLVIQHTLGLSVGVGLFTTFLYVNKSIQTQVFLQDRRSKLQCLWLLLFLVCSTLLLYYTFDTQTLYSCLVLLRPSIEPLTFWEVLWAVGITNFIIKFLCMGTKCLILLLPSALVTYRTQGRWLMLTEELAQVHQAAAPFPLWFRYLVTFREDDGAPGWTLGILLALLYLILKLLDVYKQRMSLLKTVKIFVQGEQTGTAATRSQCSEAGDVCPICQGDYREPRVLLCQHIFCDECIALWFHREKNCPLCRTVITDRVDPWRGGATSPHLQIY